MNERPSRQDLLMLTALMWAKRSTCSRLHVGCVVAKESRILVQGYNGAPAGLDHCDHTCRCFGEGYENAIYRAPEDHKSGCGMITPCDVTVHAEANTIAWAAREGIPLQDSQLFTTHSPCLACAKLIINAGISKVTYGQTFRDEAGLILLHLAGIRVSSMIGLEHHELSRQMEG